MKSENILKENKKKNGKYHRELWSSSFHRDFMFKLNIKL